MRVYVGQARGAKLVRRLWELGIGECTARGELPPRRRPWFFDNGAFGDWKAGRPFQPEPFLADIDAIYRSIDRPEFIVLPDIVAGGSASLEYSSRWIHRLRGLAPLYLAVQDGMTEDEVAPLFRHVAGIFVGGTLRWKVRTGEAWASFARQQDRVCHIGRCGSARRVRWARRIEADSIDSALPLWAERNLVPFLRALEPVNQVELFSATAKPQHARPRRRSFARTRDPATGHASERSEANG